MKKIIALFMLFQMSCTPAWLAFYERDLDACTKSSQTCEDMAKCWNEAAAKYGRPQTARCK